MRRNRRAGGVSLHAAVVVVIAAITTLAAPCHAADEDARDAQSASKSALGPLQSFVGEWKGGGTTRRGSTKGAWVEESAWRWSFEGDAAAIVFHAPGSNIYTHGRIEVGNESEIFRLTAKPAADAEEEIFTGRFDDERLIFTADQPRPGRPVEISLRLVARGRRLLAVYHKRSETSEAKRFLAEVGYTRKGSNFGRAEDAPECILTGGEASIAVSYQGKTYYVCCSGCRDYFVENPEKVLAEYRKRLAERKKGE